MLAASAAPVVIAHRGASAYAAEHTFDAYDLALAMGADVLELDVRLLADGALAVVHDRTLWRTAADPREVAKVSAAELLDLDPAVRPLLLDAVLSRYGDEARYLIDLKEPRAPLERLVATTLEAAGLAHRAQIQTFSRPGLQRAHCSGGSISLAQLYPPSPPAGAVVRDLRRVARFADAIGPEAAGVDALLVAAAHRRGLRVQPYTVNDPAEIERLLALGVDGVITDAPDLARAAIGSAAQLLAVA